MATTTSSALPLQDRVLKLVKNPQFAWFLGHVAVLAGTLFYFLSLVTFKSNPRAYSTAYLGALVSYGVVVYKSLGIPRANAAYLQKLMLDENFQYFMLAFYWYCNKPIAVTLVPFATYSVFHASSYVRSNVIPTLFPVPTAESNGGASQPVNNAWQTKVQRNIKAWTDMRYGMAMKFVAQVEVVGLMGRLILGAITFQSSLLAPLLFAHFLRLRFHLSSYTRGAFRDLNTRLDKWLLPPTAHPSIPPAVGHAYTTIKGYIIKYSQAGIQQAPQPQ
ncbi:Transmembrane nucleoporin [Umbelopsis nana]